MIKCGEKKNLKYIFYIFCANLEVFPTTGSLNTCSRIDFPVLNIMVKRLIKLGLKSLVLPGLKTTQTVGGPEVGQRPEPVFLQV